MKTSFTTNGISLTPEIIQTISDSKISSVAFSIDSLNPVSDDFEGHHNQNTLLKNINQLHEIAPETQIKANILIQNSNSEQILGLLDTLNSLPISMSILFGPNSKTDDLKLRLPQEKELALYNTIEKLKKENRWNHIVTTPLDRYRTGTRKHYYNLGKYCAQTWQNIYINQKGQITPCCLLPHMSMGNFLEIESLEKAWSTEKFKKFRKNQISVCCGCDVHR
jgi:MoaA/NifB/PqqE/SkfB family radical SAM enzyme